MINFNKIQTIIFDCDGVILDSNNIKAEAFYEIGSEFSEEAGLKLANYHKKNGGESRYKKFNYLIENILKKKASINEVQRLSKKFSNITVDNILSATIADKIYELRNKTIDKKWLVVSGSDQEELRGIFNKREISDLFDGGIFGSPDTKDTILKRELEVGNIFNPALFIGDSITDFKASKNAKMDFVFLTKWSGINNWEDFLDEESLILDSLSGLLTFFD
jgi:phosphoglycolate phosphatase-like HAD superfamily hydrolase